MPTPIVMPQQGLVEEMVVLEWLRQDGDDVAAGESVVLLETEKTQTEVEAPASHRWVTVVQLRRLVAAGVVHLDARELLAMLPDDAVHLDAR